ncbi:MAG TPA: endonuclease III [Acholeplasma sp.]|nr:endonuclease III [Acholeplasma sp.]
MNENVKILFINYLDELFPNAKAELNFSNNFELLIAVVLSAQTTDVSVNKVTPKLFKKYPTPFDLSKADVNEVETIINSIGLYRNKSKNIIELSKILVEKYNGEIPNRREALESLPGVGRKTTNVVLSNAFDVPAFAVDTHVERISKRLGIALENDSVLTVEEKLMALFPRQL